MIALSSFNFLREQTLINWSNLFQLHKIILAGTANAPRADFEATAALADPGDPLHGEQEKSEDESYLCKVGYYFFLYMRKQQYTKTPDARYFTLCVCGGGGFRDFVWFWSSFVVVLLLFFLLLFLNQKSFTDPPL